MLIILVLVIWGVSPSQVTVCMAPCAFRRGEPSQAQACLTLRQFTAKPCLRKPETYHSVYPKDTARQR
jgi:hypothetical protein